jgi:hypothetical protein
VTISNQSQAKRFFIHKTIQQAQSENIILTDAEKYMLSWSETEENFKPEQKLLDQFYTETSDEAFEKKIGELLRKAYKDDVNKDKSAKESYQKAYVELNKGDNYILIMINSAIGSKLTNKLIDRVLLLLAAIGFIVIVLGVQYILRSLGINK